MKLVIFIATACVLVAIIVPLTIKEEKQGIFITFSVSKFIQLIDFYAYSLSHDEK